MPLHSLFSLNCMTSIQIRKELMLLSDTVSFSCFLFLIEEKKAYLRERNDDKLHDHCS